MLYSLPHHFWSESGIYHVIDFFLEYFFLLSSDLVSRVNNLVGYNLPDSYLGIFLSIFTINITLGNMCFKNDIDLHSLQCL